MPAPSSRGISKVSAREYQAQAFVFGLFGERVACNPVANEATTEQRPAGNAETPQTDNG